MSKVKGHIKLLDRYMVLVLWGLVSYTMRMGGERRHENNWVAIASVQGKKSESMWVQSSK